MKRKKRVMPKNSRRKDANKKAVELVSTAFFHVLTTNHCRREILVAGNAPAFRFGFAQTFELHNRSLWLGLLF